MAGSRVRVLFLGGLGRSGTTLLERVLGQLPGAVPLGEVVHLWQRDLLDDERCGCGVSFSGCDFWRRVGQRAFGGWDAVDPHRVLRLKASVERTRHIPALRRDRLRPGFAERVTEYADHYRRIYRAAADTTGSRLVIDSSKHPSLAYCLRWSPGIDLRVLHVVRDSRGVAYSWTKTVTRPEADGDVMTRYHPLRSALLWDAHNVALDALGRCRLPLRRLRYEDFTTDPLGTVKEIAEFAGLDAGPLDFLDHAWAELGRHHTAAGNPMRFTTGRIPLYADDAWRTGLTTGRRRLVTALTAPLLRRYGYLPGPVTEAGSEAIREADPEGGPDARHQPPDSGRPGHQPPDGRSGHQLPGSGGRTAGARRPSPRSAAGQRGQPRAPLPRTYGLPGLPGQRKG